MENLMKHQLNIFLSMQNNKKTLKVIFQNIWRRQILPITLSKAVLDLVGGTGFSILSGVEIIYYYVLKLFMSLRIPRAKRASAKNKILMSFSWFCWDSLEGVQFSLDRTFDVLSVIEWHVESTHKNKCQFSSS